MSRIPEGVRYHCGAEARLRRAVEDAAMSVFDGWSYEEVATPTFDYFALFDRGMGHDAAQRAFRFTDTDGRMLALRPDVTSSVARAAATLFAHRPRPLRLCYAAPVFRQRPRSHAEWRREQTQLGCELIGAGDADADLETLVIAAEVLERLGLLDQSRITLNHVGVFNGIAAQLGLDTEGREEMRRAIDVRDSAELNRFLCARAPATFDHPLADLTRLNGQRDVLDIARRHLNNPHSLAALDCLAHLWATIEALGLSDSFEIDLADVSELNYYTGLVCKIYVAGAGARVGSGGRYNELISNFGRAEPAVGFVLDLDALTEVLARHDSALAQNGHGEAAQVQVGNAASRFQEAKQRRARGERVKMASEF
ncbi:MAG: ATP phosphoribosyltransferase regulatory subunit [Pyrinomonadaceae bacterium]